MPTWNYLAVHCTVQATLLAEPRDKDVLLKHLIGEHEPAYAEQWRSMDPSYDGKMLAGIAAFELRALRWQRKLKLNQHRPESHAAMRAAYARGDERPRRHAPDDLAGLAAGALTLPPDGCELATDDFATWPKRWRWRSR